MTVPGCDVNVPELSAAESKYEKSTFSANRVGEYRDLVRGGQSGRWPAPRPLDRPFVCAAYRARFRSGAHIGDGGNVGWLVFWRLPRFCVLSTGDRRRFRRCAHAGAVDGREGEDGGVRIGARRRAGGPTRVSLGRYLLGVLDVAVVVAVLAFGARGLRVWLLPNWQGALARLAEIVAGLAAVVLVGAGLGTVGQFRLGGVVFALVVAGCAAGLLGRRSIPRCVAATESLRSVPLAPAARWSKVANFAALALAGVVVAQWSAHVIASYSGGIWDGDSLWYHLPFATYFLQTGSTTTPLFTNADTLVTYFPANTELLLATVMLPFHRDVLVPLVNLGWLVLALGAGWTIGRAWRAPAVGMAGVTVAMAIPVVAATQAGTARNDAAGIALFLTAVALVVHARWDRAGLVFAGAAAGLAIGVKLSVVVPVLSLAVAVLVTAPGNRRRSILLPWALPIVVVGSYWYLRNLMCVGNPVPLVAVRLGPLSLPSVLATSIANTAIIERMREPDAFAQILRPGLEFALGASWWFLVLLVPAILVGVLVRGPDRLARMLAIVSMVAVLAYLIMPNGAPGTGFLVCLNFAGNVRYVIPALALALALTAALPGMADGRLALGTIAVFAGIVYFQFAERGFAQHWEWQISTGQRWAGALLVLGAAAVSAGLWFARRRGARAFAAVVTVVVVGVGVAAYFVQRGYLRHRYAHPRADGERASPLWPWAQDLPATRLGIVGDLFQYPFSGRALQTSVRYVGVAEPDGGFRSVRTCTEWRRALADGRFEYVVAALDAFSSNAPEVERIDRWTLGIPGTRVVVKEGSATVYRLTNVPDPDACP